MVGCMENPAAWRRYTKKAHSLSFDVIIAFSYDYGAAIVNNAI